MIWLSFRNKPKCLKDKFGVGEIDDKMQDDTAMNDVSYSFLPFYGFSLLNYVFESVI